MLYLNKTIDLLILDLEKKVEENKKSGKIVLMDNWKLNNLKRYRDGNK